MNFELETGTRARDEGMLHRIDGAVRLLIHLPNWLGDAVMSLPAVEAAARWEGCRVTLLGRNDPLSLTGKIPGIERRWTLPQRPRAMGGLGWFMKVARKIRGPFDAALTLSPSFSSAALLVASGAPVRVGWTGDGRSLLLNRLWKRKRRGRIHLSREYADLIRSLGIPEVEEVPRLRWGEGELDAARGHVEPLGGRRAVALAPGAVYGPTKRWPLERYQLLGRRLLELGLGVVWIGGPAEKGTLSKWMRTIDERAPWIDVMGLLSVRESAAVLAQCRVAVTNDSGAMHLAQAAGCPTVALFGSTEPRWTGPQGVSRVLRNPVACSPCFLSRCPHGLECWGGIEVEQVMDAVVELLDTGDR
jgi:heptosyltransferase-2